MATDALIASNGVLATLSEETMASLNENLPSFWSHGNPVDVLGDARAKRVAKATQIVLADKNVDAVLVIMTPQAMTNPNATAKEISTLVSSTNKPILAAWLGGQSMHEADDILVEAGIPSYKTPEQAIHAFMTMVSYSRNLEPYMKPPAIFPLNSRSTVSVPAKSSTGSSKRTIRFYPKRLRKSYWSLTGSHRPDPGLHPLQKRP